MGQYCSIKKCWKMKLFSQIKNSLERFPRSKSLLILIRDSCVFYFIKLLILTGVHKTHYNYNKFVIVCLPRTGSNLLRSLINSHSNTIAFGEIFRFEENIGWDLRYYPQLKWLNQKKNERPWDFLNDEIFSRHLLHVKAVGFKLFYHHARNEKQIKIWDFIRNSDEDIKIIHLRRENYLRRFISYKRAKDSGRWVKLKKDEIDNYSTELAFDECIKFFEYTDAEEKNTEKFFSGKNILTITYENLVSDTKKEMERVFGYLGIPSEKVKSETYKQIKRPLPESITNYHKLKDKFSKSKWEIFFDE